MTSMDRATRDDKAGKIVNFATETLNITDVKLARRCIGRAYGMLTAQIKKTA